MADNSQTENPALESFKSRKTQDIITPGLVVWVWNIWEEAFNQGLKYTQTEKTTKGEN